ncbi:hypothetical protein BHYA_0258g00010 [Botrytis hyacinthi]|uniref:F-box domain-containing protein n=1 Tax=Botrytis hyacinthi TaxID=278943 RepID=A0A4Z1G8C7_9HELO|nr:hypothetical protein BHYA_0258g00010 [Botrytis hyacinthi]
MAPSRRTKILKLLPSRVRKIFTSGAASKISDDKSSVDNPFPFLQLPAELRIQIYKQLSPKSKPNYKNFIGITEGHLRRDSELERYVTERCSKEDDSRCYPEILRLNRQIYHEAMPLWYGVDELHLWLINPASEFHKETILSCDLPYFLRFMTSLRIDIFTEDDDVSLALKSERPQMSTFLAEFGNRLAEHGNLKQLHVRFSLRTPMRLPPSAAPSHLLGSLLESYLEPFRGISGLLNLKTSIDVRPDPFAHEINQIDLGTRIYSSVEEDARAYLDTFESEMLQTTKSIH